MPENASAAHMEGKMGKPVISVIVPVYNAEKYLLRSAGSIQKQTLQNIEILLVDDGSADGSLSLAQKIAGSDARVKVLHKENGGASTARNAGVQAASAELVGFVDSDDYIEADMYESLLAAYTVQREKTGSGSFLVQAGREEEDEGGRPLPAALPLPEHSRLVDPEHFMESLLLYTGDSSFCTKLVPRKLLLAHPFPEGVMGEDFLLHMQMLPDTGGVLLIPKAGYHVVHRAGSATRRADASCFSRSCMDIVDHADYVESRIVPGYPALRTAARRFGLYERLDYLLHVPIADMRADNVFYRNVLGYLRSHFADTWRNPFLTAKDRLYLTLLTAAPAFTRKVHKAIRHPV